MTRFCLVFAAFLGISNLDHSVSFVVSRTHYQHRARSISSQVSRVGATTGSDTVERLINAVDATKDDSTKSDNDRGTIEGLMDDLDGDFKADKKQSIKDDDPRRFEPLLGLYDVAYVAKAQEKDNPVGGKWTRQTGFAQKILQTRRTFQHLLATNATGLRNPSVEDSVAEAVNVVSLDGLWGLIRLTVILRGDAVPVQKEERASNKIPLTNLAARVFFDSPRIFFGKSGRLLNLYLGPTSSVVLDCTFVDDRVRIGRGGVSGTRFVFARCPDDDEEALEFKSLVTRKPTKKSRVIAILGVVAGISLSRAVKNPGFRIVGSVVTGFASLLALGLGLSTGGIEQGDVSYRKGMSNTAQT